MGLPGDARMDTRARIALFLLAAGMALAPLPASAEFILNLGPEERVQAGGADILVPGYSGPSFDYWDGDDLKDLIIGEGSGTVPNARVRVYLNVGTAGNPSFSSFFYAQAAGSDLTAVGGG